MSVLEAAELRNLFLDMFILRHREEEDDDDFRRWRQVQGLHGLLHTGANSIVLLVCRFGSSCCKLLQVLKNEGFMSLMKGAGANVLRGVAGAGVLAGFDKFKEVYIAFRTGN